MTASQSAPDRPAEAARLAQATKAITRTRTLLDAAFADLHQRCCGEHGFEAQRLDDFQQVCFDLAHAVAALTAASAFNDFAAGEDHSLLLRLSLSFTAQILQDCDQRLAVHASQHLPAACWQQWRHDPDRLQLCDSVLHPDWLALTGERIAAGDGEDLPSGLDQEKQLIQSSFRRFADTVVAPQAEAIHRQDLDIPDALIAQAAELGSFGTCIPQRFGGLQPDHEPDSLAMIVVTEALSRASLGAAGSLITRPEIAARALLAGGTAAQQQAWLPRLASGECLCAIAITEADAGSDVAAVSLRARPADGGWRLSGSKTWSTFAGRSELLVVLARSEEGASGYRGLSLFLVEKPAFAGRQFSHQQAGGGRLSGKAIATLGYRGMHSFELFFDDYFVPAANLVGEQAGQGQGFYFTMSGFAGGRLQTAARANGVMQAAFDAALMHASTRRTFGKTIAEHQVIRIKLARMLALIMASRLCSYAVARAMDKGAGSMQASLVKLFACRAAEWVTREAMQIHGGLGYAEESPVSRFFVDARVLSIFEGTEEVLALKVIARELVAKAGRQAPAPGG